MKSVLDPSFRYTPSYGTNLKATFARVRREMRRGEGHPENVATDSKILPIRPGKGIAGIGK